MLHYLKENIDRSLAFFQEEMPWVKVSAPEGTYLLWLDMSASGVGSRGRHERLINKGKVVLGSRLLVRNPGKGLAETQRRLPLSLLEEGLRRVKAAF